MSTHARTPCPTRRWLVLATCVCVGACAGTPTPEPPDYLPTPNGELIFGRELAVPMVQIATDSAAPVPLIGAPGAVTPDSDLWIVNLDNLDAEPLTVRARANGSFSTQVAAREGNRIRLVSRNERQHSLPLDALYGAFDASAQRPSVSVMRLPPTELSCLAVQPAEEITRVVEAGESRSERFELTNRCGKAAQITDARLRFGDQGFSLATPPTSVPVNGTASLTVTLSGHDDAREHGDILLLDVRVGDQDGPLGRYALGVWSVSSSGSGND
jgi:hypothetical protein